MRATTDVWVQYGDHVDVTYIPLRTVPPIRGGSQQEYPAALHVHFGGFNLHGRPEDVLRLLCEAVAKGESAERGGAAAGEVVSDV